LLKPLVEISKNSPRKIIYTGLAEAFFAYLKLSLFSAFLMVLPIICYQFYAFIKPGLHEFERKVVRIVLIFSPMLFYGAAFFVFYFVMPRAWEFFLSYENNNLLVPLVMEARISEYLELTVQLMIVFGLAFQLPIVMIILSILGLIDARFLKEKRRIAIVLIFIIAAIFTPPDVISQIALAIPLVFLYEISIIFCKLVENKKG
jgi:sec-independent protein translocase protein TatC